MRSDRDLQTLEARARLHAAAWLKKAKASANPTSESVPNTDPGALAFRASCENLTELRSSVGMGLPSTGHGIAYLAWKFRGHLFVDDHAWHHFYRTLALRYADKYPDITAADWDACVSHVASTAFLLDTVMPVMVSVISTTTRQRLTCNCHPMCASASPSAAVWHSSAQCPSTS